MSKTKETRQQTFEEWMKGNATESEATFALRCLARGDFGAVACLMREAYEAGAAARELVNGTPAFKLRRGDLFRKLRGKQVYMKMDVQHLDLCYDRDQRIVAVNAKGNPIKLDRNERVVRCEESEFFAAKDL